MNNETQDKYLDAFFEILMKEFAESEVEILLRNSKEEPYDDVPKELDQKCKALIRRKFAKEKFRRAWSVMGTISKRVAMVTVVFLGIFSALFLSVDAIRTPLINFYLKNMDNHSVLIIDDSGLGITQDPPVEEYTGMLISRLAELIPDEYDLAEEHFDENGVGFVYFTNAARESISFSMTSGSSLYAVDTEDCSICERIIGMDIEGYYIEKGNRETVVWFDLSQGKICTLASEALQKDDLLRIASALHEIEKIDSLT